MVENALRKHAPCAVSVKSVCAYAAVNGGAARLTVCTSARDTWVSRALTFSHKTERVNENCRKLDYV